MKKIIRFVLTALLMSIGLFCTIKDDNGNPAISGPNSPVTPITPVKTPGLLVSPDSTYVGVGDTLGIRIRVFSDSTMSDSTPPLANALVTVSVNRGSVSAESLYTDSNGRASVYFSAADSGSVSLTVKTYGVQQTIKFDVTNTPTQVEPLFQVSALSSIIKADGLDNTTIMVHVMNASHNPLVGVAVQFVTTAGTIAGLAQPPGNPGQGITDASGIARATLTSTNINDTAFVSAFLASNSQLNGEVKVAFQGVSIALETDSTNLKPEVPAIITAKVLNASDSSIPFRPIFFSMSKGLSSNIQIVKADSATGFDGTAMVIVKGLKTGSDSLIVSSSGARTNIKINITDLSLKLSVDESTIQAGKGLFTNLHASFTDGTGAALKNKAVQVVCHFKTAGGADTADTVSTTTDSLGNATAPISSLNYDATITLDVTAFNTSDDVASGVLTVKVITTRNMTIAALPSVIQADGSSYSTITVQMKNSSNNPIVGDNIIFSTDIGMITGTSVTDSSGKASAKLTSDRRNAVATVVAAWANDPTKNATAQVEFSGVTITVAATPQSINSNGADTSTVLMTLLDAMKNPIAGEPVNFSKLFAATKIAAKDSVTDSRGDAQCKVVGTGSGQDTITVQAAGAIAKTTINYSTNYLTIDTLPGAFASTIAQDSDSTEIQITYMKGDRSTPITDSTQLQVCATLGTVSDTLFAKTLIMTAADKGYKYFYLKNPTFSNTATIAVTAISKGAITVASFNLYFRANSIAKITLTGTPQVISTNGDQAKLIAIATDSKGNRVANAVISFNLLAGPGAGEHLNPPSAVTAVDGSATTYLISGTIPSQFNSVLVAAGDFTALKSDTVKFTIAGPPAHITIRRNVAQINKYAATYGNPCAAIISDVNGNPVADGTQVTFTCQVTGYQIYYLSAFPTAIQNTFPQQYSWTVDTLPKLLPFEDLNNNFKLDPGEDVVGDGILHRGEDWNGDGIYQPGPPFEDINWNGTRDMSGEPAFYYWDTTADANGKTHILKHVVQNAYDDLNGNGHYDPWEPLLDSKYQAAYQLYLTGNWTVEDTADVREIALASGNVALANAVSLMDSMDAAYWTQSRAIANTQRFDYDWNQSGICEPNTAVLITRTVQTVGGVANNEIIYGQSDALHYQVKAWAEAQGNVSSSPEQFILPILEADLPYWTYK